MWMMKSLGFQARGGDERVLLAPRDDRSFLPGERLVVMASSFQEHAQKRASKSRIPVKSVVFC